MTYLLMGNLTLSVDGQNSHQRCSVSKSVLRKFAKFTGKYTCARASFLIKLQPCKFIEKRPATLLKKRLWRSCFPVNFVTFLRTPFLQNTSDNCFSMGEALDSSHLRATKGVKFRDADVYTFCIN